MPSRDELRSMQRANIGSWWETIAHEIRILVPVWDEAFGTVPNELGQCHSYESSYALQ